jgi:hypothetical protein
MTADYITAIIWTVVNLGGLVAAAYVLASARKDYKVAREYRTELSDSTMIFLRSHFRSQIFRVTLLSLFAILGLVILVVPAPRSESFLLLSRVILITGIASITLDSLLSGIERRKFTNAFGTDEDDKSRII